MKRIKISCPYCGQEVSKSNFSKHLRRHKNHPETFDTLHINKETMCCQFCGKHYNKTHSLSNHERFCELNPNREIETLKKLKAKENKSHPAWNKGLTKETDTRIAKGWIKRKETLQKNPRLKGIYHHSEEIKQFLREQAIQNNLGGRCYRNQEVINGILLDSSYEVCLAKSLIENNIKWERGKKFFYKDDKDKKHRYTPDFYLPEYDIYLDPKNDYLINNINPTLGYKDVDKIKWVCEQNNIRVIILNKNELTWDIVKTKIQNCPDLSMDRKFVF